MSDGEDDGNFQDCLAEEEFAKEFADEEEKYYKKAESSDEEKKEPEQKKDDEEDKSQKSEEENLVEQSLEEALKTKVEATDLYKTGDIQGAINKYSLAIQQCPVDEKRNKAMLHNNIGLCLIKMHENTAETEEPAKPADDKEKQVFSF